MEMRKAADELDLLARAIADQAARDEIETHCLAVYTGARPWYDTASAPPEDVESAVEKD